MPHWEDVGISVVIEVVVGLIEGVSYLEEEYRKENWTYTALTKP